MRTLDQTIEYVSEFIDEVNKHLQDPNCEHSIHEVVDGYLKGLQNGTRTS